MDLLHRSSSSSSSSSANLASRGRDNGRGNRGHNSRTRGNDNPGRGRGGFNSGKTKVKCHLCKKEGHSVIYCWYRFDENFVVPEEKSANSAHHGRYDVDSNWYTDNGSTNHITGELDKMVIRDRYSGGEQIHSFKRQMGQVWILHMLVVLFVIHPNVNSSLTMFCMSLAPQRI
jgi:hypothetical protein